MCSDVDAVSENKKMVHQKRKSSYQKKGELKNVRREKINSTSPVYDLGLLRKKGVAEAETRSI
jgi:hypothetical protein